MSTKEQSSPENGTQAGFLNDPPALVRDGRTEVREGYADVGDVRLHYVEAGDGPLIVLLHGFPEFWYGWRLQIAPLAAAGFRVVAPDLRGYNLSSKPDGVAAYGADQLAADVRGLIHERGAESALLVGHDWGGTAAWAVAMNHPRSSTGWPSSTRAIPRKLNEGLRHPSQLRRSWYFFYFQLPGLPEHHVRADDWQFFQDFLRDAQPPYTPEEIEALHRGVVAARSSSRDDQLLPRCGATVAEASRSAASPDLGAHAGHLGERDRYLGPTLAEPHHDDVPNLDRVERLPDASHWVHHDEAERVNQNCSSTSSLPPAQPKTAERRRRSHWTGPDEPEFFATEIRAAFESLRRSARANGPHRLRESTLNEETHMSVTTENPSVRVIRPFQVGFSDAEITDLRRRISATRWPERETVDDDSQGRAARDHAGARALLGDGLRLEQVRGEAERPAELHDRDRRAGHPLHPRPLAARGRAAAHRHARLARLDHRAAEDHRAAHGSHGARRQRGGRLPCGDPLAAGPRVLRPSRPPPAGIPSASRAPGSC